MSCAAAFATAFRNREHDVEEDGKSAAGHRGDRLGEQVYDGDQEQRQRDEPEPNRYLHAANREIKRDLKFSLAWTGVAENEDGEPIHRKTPDHTERVEVREESHITVADDDGDDLERHDDVDEIAGTEAPVRSAKPCAEHSVWGDAIQHTARADDCGVDVARQNKGSDH